MGGCKVDAKGEGISMMDAKDEEGVDVEVGRLVTVDEVDGAFVEHNLSIGILLTLSFCDIVLTSHTFTDEMPCETTEYALIISYQGGVLFCG
jgi:hypothetical protein